MCRLRPRRQRASHPPRVRDCMFPSACSGATLLVCLHAVIAFVCFDTCRSLCPFFGPTVDYLHQRERQTNLSTTFDDKTTTRPFVSTRSRRQRSFGPPCMRACMFPYVWRGARSYALIPIALSVRLSARPHTSNRRRSLSVWVSLLSVSRPRRQSLT